MLEDKIKELLEIYSKEIYTAYKDKLGNYELAKTITYNVISNNYRYEVVFNLESYWKYIENGRQAGTFPNIDSILKWIRIKSIIPREVNGKLPTEKQLSFLISRKIRDNGIEARPYLQESIDEVFESLVNDISSVVSDYIISTVFTK